MRRLKRDVNALSIGLLPEHCRRVVLKDDELARKVRRAYMNFLQFLWRYELSRRFPFYSLNHNNIVWFLCRSILHAYSQSSAKNLQRLHCPYAKIDYRELPKVFFGGVQSRLRYCFMMRPRSSVEGAIRTTQLQLREWKWNSFMDKPTDFPDWLHGFPRLFTDTSGHIRFFTFCFFFCCPLFSFWFRAVD